MIIINLVLVESWNLHHC